MPQSLSQVYVHLVWSTKGRARVLSPEVRALLFPYMAGIIDRIGSPARLIGGVEDHAHCLCRPSRTLSISDVVGRTKESSSKWLLANHHVPANFRWQGGYGAFSISPSHLEATVAYIANQEAHHRTASFQDEFRRLLVKYGLPVVEEYLWD